MRVACAFIPRFELAVHARSDPGLWSRLLVVAELSGRLPRVLCATPAAEARGVRAGQPLRPLRAQLPELELCPPATELQQQTEREVLSALAHHAPWLDLDHRGGFFLGLAGLRNLVPDEERFARGVRERLEGLGLSAGVAVADGPFAAWVWARRLSLRTQPPYLACIPPGEDPKAVREVPLVEVGLSDGTAQLLSALGLHTLGALAQLPPGALARRLGREGAQLERLARGEFLNAAPSEQHLPRDAASAELDLEYPTAEWEPLLFVFKSLLSRLLGEVASARQCLAELEVVARLDDRTELRHALVPARPTLEAPRLLELLRLWLSTQPFPAPVTALRLVARQTAPATLRQLQLFEQREEEAVRALEQAVAKLRSAFGAEAVVRPVLQDTHRPDARLRWEPFALSLEAHGKKRLPPALPTWPRAPFAPTAEGRLRLLGDRPLPPAWRQLAPPEPVELRRGWLRRPGRRAVRVTPMEEPVHRCGEWWTTTGFAREELWLAGEGGELFWVYRDLPSGQHFLQALGD